MKELRAPRSGAFSMKKEAFREFRAPGALQGTCTGGAPAGGGTAGPAGLPSPREAGATERRARPLVDLAGGVQRALVAARAWGAAETQRGSRLAAGAAACHYPTAGCCLCCATQGAPGPEVLQKFQ